MTPKKNEYPVHLRQTVIKHVLNDHSEHEIPQKLIIPQTSVQISTKKQNAFKILSIEIENVRPLYMLTELYSEK